MPYIDVRVLDRKSGSDEGAPEHSTLFPILERKFPSVAQSLIDASAGHGIKGSEVLVSLVRLEDVYTVDLSSPIQLHVFGWPKDMTAIQLKAWMQALCETFAGQALGLGLKRGSVEAEAGSPSRAFCQAVTGPETWNS